MRKGDQGENILLAKEAFNKGKKILTAKFKKSVKMIVKALLYPTQRYGRETWTLKKWIFKDWRRWKCGEK